MNIQTSPVVPHGFTCPSDELNHIICHVDTSRKASRKVAMWEQQRWLLVRSADCQMIGNLWDPPLVRYVPRFVVRIVRLADEEIGLIFFICFVPYETIVHAGYNKHPGHAQCS